MSEKTYPWTVVDLFSGAGGMSYGFHAHPRFKIIGAADAEIGKPSTGFGALDCNNTYEANIGVKPIVADLGTADPEDIWKCFRSQTKDGCVDVLVACPPCTGFSRALSTNHLKDDPRNSHITRVAVFVETFRPRVLIMENARELLKGKFSHHADSLCKHLEVLGYDVWTGTHFLSAFGLPQFRERAILIAAKRPLTLRTLVDLWDGYSVKNEAITLRRAIKHLPSIDAGEYHSTDKAHTCTHSDGLQLRRLLATPKSGGSWIDWTLHPDAAELLIPSMRRSIEAGTTNHFCDVYGRMTWDKPAPTIKRECSHIGNGRYAHPEQHRLCSVREMATLQGFPIHYRFLGKSRKNMYRAIGDAVPPLISYQLACVTEWIFDGLRPRLTDAVLPDTHLRADDIIAASALPSKNVQKNSLQLSFL